MSSSNTPRRSPVQEALDAVEMLCDYAYEKGFHEMGYDPVEVLRNALQSETGTTNAAPQACADGVGEGSGAQTPDPRLPAVAAPSSLPSAARFGSDTPRMDATLGKGADWIFAEGCKLERELAALRSAIGAQWIPTSEGIPVIEGQWLIVRWNERVSPRYECVEYTEDCIDWDMTTHWMVMQNPTDSGSEDK